MNLQVLQNKDHGVSTTGFNTKFFEDQKRLLRLRGGMGFPFEEEEQPTLKSPFKECRSIMDKLDQILASYKSSLGPCGEATCPYSQNMMQDNCRKKCPQDIVVDLPPKEECEVDPCFNEECPYKPQKKRFEPGCGSANCAYSRYKLGLVDQDASLEYMMLPPAVSGKCGSPNCDYPLQPDLPPIHWDCPDPLPKGACKNLNCPHQPPELKKIKVRDTNKKICSCQDCPYAFPPPCGMPSCPFRENPCPFLEKQKEPEETCSNPNCPFTSGTQGTAEYDEPKLKGEIVACSNPNCPFANENGKKEEEKEEYRELCRNPNCPFNEESKTTQPPTEGRGAYVKKEHPAVSATNPVCSNENCPFQKNNNKANENDRPSSEECTKPKADCEEIETKCENLKCPYATDDGKESLCYYADEIDENEERRRSRKSGSIVVENKIVVTNKSNPEKQDVKPRESTKGKNKKCRGKFVYSMGNGYPGVKIGHKECVTEVYNVPPKMGWLWNIPPPIQRLKPRRGWKPGAITKSIAARIRAHRQAKGLGMLRVPKLNNNREELEDFSGRDVKVTPKPTLYIQKKEGIYSIVMNPLKDPKTLAENEDPYMECTPMRFKISPTNPKKTGSQTCFCDEYQELSSSSESELDIEFTPPAGIIHPERFKRKLNVIHCETQYNPLDIEKPKPEIKENAKDVKKGKKGEKAKKGKGGKGGGATKKGKK